METLREVEVDGVVHSLGVVKMFAKEPDLAQFIPDANNLAMSWVRLEDGEELAVHEHPEASLILICEGTGQTMGAVERDVVAGDIVMVPSHVPHGFRGTGSGYWALSIQFNGQALYEDPEHPNAAFHGDGEQPALVDELLAANEEYVKQFQDSTLLRLLDEPAIKDADVVNRLLDCQQAWSDVFQDLLHLRVALSEDPAHKEVALDHLREELGHNNNLREQRGGTQQPVSDAEFDAAMQWFKSEMLHRSDMVRTLLMHLVLEASGEVWHREASRVFVDLPHFRDHGEDDGDHVLLGLDLLRGAGAADAVELRKSLREGWQMITLLCDRIAAFATAEPAEAVAR